MNKIHLPNLQSLPRLAAAAFIVTIFLALYIDIWPLYLEWDELSEKIKSVTGEIAQKEEALNAVHLKSEPRLVPQVTLAEEMMAAVTQSQAKMQLFKLIPREDKKGWQTEVELQWIGSFQSVYQFWMMIVQHQWPCVLERFAIRSRGDKLAVSFKFKAVALTLPLMSDALPPLDCCERDPFHMPSSLNDDLSHLDIEQIHYVGYLKEENSIEGFILLENGNLLDVSIGLLLGREGWRITAISPAELTLMQDSSQQKKIIKKEDNAIV